MMPPILSDCLLRLPSSFELYDNMKRQCLSPAEIGSAFCSLQLDRLPTLNTLQGTDGGINGRMVYGASDEHGLAS